MLRIAASLSVAKDENQTRQMTYKVEDVIKCDLWYFPMTCAVP